MNGGTEPDVIAPLIIGENPDEYIDTEPTELHMLIARVGTFIEVLKELSLDADAQDVERALRRKGFEPGNQLLLRGDDADRMHLRISETEEYAEIIQRRLRETLERKVGAL